MVNAAIILAAGKGIRMKSDLPKVFHKLCGKPILSYVLDAAGDVGFDETYVVVGHRSELLKDFYKDSDIVFVDQKKQLGTAHAVSQVEPYIKGREAMIVVLAGDMPLISGETIKDLIACHKDSNAAATLLVAKVDDPKGYGRVVRSASGEVIKIVEEKDATEDEKNISEINTGIYCFESKVLFDVLNEVKSDNTQKEFYLTDAIGLIKKKDLPVFSLSVDRPEEAMGINTKEQLENLERMLQ